MSNEQNSCFSRSDEDPDADGRQTEDVLTTERFQKEKQTGKTCLRQRFVLPHDGGPGTMNDENDDDVPSSSSSLVLSKKITEALRESKEFVHGSDSDGRKYATIDDMWRSVSEKGGVMGSNNWYQRSTDYYDDHCPASLDGVLGGFASISELDLEGSRQFTQWLQNTVKRSPSSSSSSSLPIDWSQGAGCECGAGIGRVTKGLLLPLGVKRCDLVESCARILSEAPNYIGEPGASRCRYYCSGLQDWTPTKDSYTIIWIQWVLCYLTDDDCVAFLKRCGDGLMAGGIICLKENTCQDEAFVLDNEDASVTRSIPYLLRLVDEAGLCVIAQQTQDNFPDDIYPVPMIALEVKEARR